MGPPVLGKRHTRQREMILQVFEEAQGPLTVQEVHAQAQHELTGLGIATVYRTLKLLREQHQIDEITLPNGETRYERVGLSHHHHFQCVECQRVFDVEICPISIPQGTTLPGDYLVEGHEVTLCGRCPDCLTAPSKQSARRRKPTSA